MASSSSLHRQQLEPIPSDVGRASGSLPAAPAHNPLPSTLPAPSQSAQRMESLLEAILAEQKEAKEDRAKLAAQVEKLSAIVARTPPCVVSKRRSG